MAVHIVAFENTGILIRQLNLDNRTTGGIPIPGKTAKYASKL
jgi:hypothetical protein